MWTLRIRPRLRIFEQRRPHARGCRVSIFQQGLLVSWRHIVPDRIFAARSILIGCLLIGRKTVVWYVGTRRRQL